MKGGIKLNSYVQTITANIPIKNDNQGFFRVFLMSCTNGWLPEVLITSRGDINPLDYSEEVYGKLVAFLKLYGLDLEKCRVYLDLVEYLGIREPFLFKWEFKKNGCLKSQVEPVAFSNLSLDASNLIRNYYSDKWSMFNESLLTNEEKAEIVGDLLSTSVYDETSAESTSLLLKYKLFDAIENGNKVRWESKIN